MIKIFEIVLLAVVVCDQLCAQELNDGIQNQQSQRRHHISELQADYLKNEDNLWNRIEQALSDSHPSSDQYKNETFDDIVKLHRTIFFEKTFETNNYWRSYLIFGIENLRDYLLNVNSTLEENYGFLFDDSEQFTFDASKIEQWTRPTMFRRLKENTNGLFDLTISQKDTISQHIQNVSDIFLLSTRNFLFSRIPSIICKRFATNVITLLFSSSFTLFML